MAVRRGVDATPTLPSPAPAWAGSGEVTTRGRWRVITTAPLATIGPRLASPFASPKDRTEEQGSDASSLRIARLCERIIPLGDGTCGRRGLPRSRAHSAANPTGVPRLCRGGSQSLTDPGVYAVGTRTRNGRMSDLTLPLCAWFASPASLNFGVAFKRLRKGPFEGPATVKPPALPEDIYLQHHALPPPCCPVASDHSARHIAQVHARSLRWPGTRSTIKWYWPPS